MLHASITHEPTAAASVVSIEARQGPARVPGAWRALRSAHWPPKRSERLVPLAKTFGRRVSMFQR